MFLHFPNLIVPSVSCWDPDWESRPYPGDNISAKAWMIQWNESWEYVGGSAKILQQQVGRVIGVEWAGVSVEGKVKD